MLLAPPVYLAGEPMPLPQLPPSATFEVSVEFTTVSSPSHYIGARPC